MIWLLLLAGACVLAWAIRATFLMPWDRHNVTTELERRQRAWDQED